MELFNRRGVVSKELFPFIYWEGMSKVMRSFPAMLCTWITKHVSHFNCTNRQLIRWDKTGSVVSVCPNCKRHDESTTHINRCPDKRRRSVMVESVRELEKWLKSKQTDKKLISLICNYIRGMAG